MGIIVVFTKVANMTMSAEELYRDRRKMTPNLGENEIVFKACRISKGCMTYNHNQVDVVGFRFKNVLEPRFNDKFIDRLTSRYKFIVSRKIEENAKGKDGEIVNRCCELSI